LGGENTISVHLNGTNLQSDKCETSKESASRSRKRKADVAIYLQDPDEEVAEMTKKKQYEILVSNNVVSAFYVIPISVIPTPDKELHEPVSVNKEHFVQYTFKNIFVTPTRSSPLPVLGWADKDDVWNNLMKKEKTYLRDRGNNKWSITYRFISCWVVCVFLYNYI
uniref:Cyclin E1 n=1 Tax=Erpetoichthys calabaricus TaxID=27687 RepID=A0A8C4RWC0_ERPCA